MNKELLAGVSRIVDSVRITDSNKKLEEYLLGSLRANGLETMVNIGEHKDGYRISLQGYRQAYVDVYMDGEHPDWLAVEASDAARGYNGEAIKRYAKFAGISWEQAGTEIERLYRWFAELLELEDEEPESIKNLKVTDAAGKDKGFAPFALDSEDFDRKEGDDGQGGKQVVYTLSDPKEYYVEEAWFLDDAKNMDREWSHQNPTRWWTYVKFNNNDDWEGEIKGTPDQVADEIREIIEEYFTKGEKHVADAALTDGVEDIRLEMTRDPMSGHGGTKNARGIWYYTWDQAVAAAKAVGDGWRLPTQDEFYEILNGAIRHSFDYKYNGYLLVNKKNHALTILAALGYAEDNIMASSHKEDGYLWTATSSSKDKAEAIFFDPDGIYDRSMDKSCQLPVWLVREIPDTKGKDDKVEDAAGTASKLLTVRLKDDTSKLLAELAEKEQALGEFIDNWKKSHADNPNGYIKDKDFQKIRRRFLDVADRYAEHIAGLVHKYAPTQY